MTERFAMLAQPKTPILIGAVSILSEISVKRKTCH